ncbi:DUF6480 family protein [Streptomyces sp. DSM 44915]|uniref:DUF6480 family protein n=1 Tax=Streptomyces chisholmiae TaxID=3075540 RepID=A0ABU2JYQ9_9ACTN|nr:DUF6480 family protein [Streptomyces sp. DSM 44915]MDT0269893.1 DUF6480 family protein [Streptomyces sp. DSM 44915]
MTVTNTDPDPYRTPGYRPGGATRPDATPPGETPPAEGGTSFTGPDDSHNPVTGWAAGPLIAVLVVAGLMVAFFLAYAVWFLVN